MKLPGYYPCSEGETWHPGLCPPADLRCTGCAHQPGLLPGLLRGIKRALGISRPMTHSVRVESALRRWMLLLTYGAKCSDDSDVAFRKGTELSWQDWRDTMTAIVWKETREWVRLPGGSEDRMPAVHLVALLRYVGRYPVDFPEVARLMRTPHYRAGMRRIEATLEARKELT